MFSIERPVLVTFKHGATCIADTVFRHADGACFVALWWDTPEGQPFHVLEGELADNGGGAWTVGGCTLRTLTKNDEEWDEWQRWLDHKESEGYLTDEMLITAAIRSGAIVD